ncbi:MAG: hypothetical protein A2042_01525 [Candidatus Schekmanbacteria bacterium GWA2_38_11]|uniref:Lipoprotein n=1 Tax=Candidatus Schekmanbacteria bacterium GWA2_38_11 TaxID=1817876 RepID=A0A1F7RP79_9BACT|nr:MAG: hypothetical protein A2042_01525 [Candidatus Schekmanbacteria bacterium GWA2_38_11]
MVNTKSISRFFLIFVFTLITSCAHYHPILPDTEIKKLSNEEFKNYFIKRLDEVILVQVFSNKLAINKPVSDGTTIRNMRVGTISSIISRDEPLFKQCRAEYEILKSELTKRSQGKDNQLFTETMGKAEKLLEEHLDRIWYETQNIAGQEIDYSQFETEFVDFKKFYEIRLHNDKAKGNLVDILFEKPYFESSY